jgi:hypothetical protein
MYADHGLLLKDLFVSINKEKAGVQRVMLVFRQALGCISPLFQSSYYTKPISSLKSNLATKVLSDVVLPMLNLASFQNTSGSKLQPQECQQVLAAWGEKEAELRFYVDLIGRYAETLTVAPVHCEQHLALSRAEDKCEGHISAAPQE